MHPLILAVFSLVVIGNPRGEAVINQHAAPVAALSRTSPPKTYRVTLILLDKLVKQGLNSVVRHEAGAGDSVLVFLKANRLTPDVLAAALSTVPAIVRRASSSTASKVDVSLPDREIRVASPTERQEMAKTIAQLRATHPKTFMTYGMRNVLTISVTR